MIRRARLAQTIALLAAVAVGVLALHFHDAYRRPGPLDAETSVVIAKGTAVTQIALQLAETGVVSSAYIFRLGVRLMGGDVSLQAGEYLFPARISTREVVHLMLAGKTRVRRLTVPEGLTSAQIVTLVRDAEGLQGDIEVVPAEGTLLPETYHYIFGDRRDALIQRMSAAMTALMAETWANQAPGLPIATPQQALVLASIVERETPLAAERPRVAAVFINRIRLGMRLQADPTVAYALSDGTGLMERPLTQADLAHPSPFNTYHIDGLPPRPIGNPGRDAILAVLNPAATAELYFVADGTGGHVFAETLEEHNRNVARWRALRRRPTP